MNIDKENEMDIIEIKEEKTSDENSSQNFEAYADQISTEEISAKFESTSGDNAGANTKKETEKGTKFIDYAIQLFFHYQNTTNILFL